MGRFEGFTDDREIAFHHRAAFGAELLRKILLDFIQHHLVRGTGDDAIDMAADCTNEGDAHHPGFEFRCRCVWFGNLKSVDDKQLDLFVADGLAGLRRQFLPDLDGGQLRLENEGAAFHQPAQRIGVAENLMVGRDDNFDVLDLCIALQHRLGTERDVVVRGRATLLRAIFRRSLGVEIEHAC